MLWRMSEKLKDLPAHVVEQLAGRTWDELQTLEYAGYILFPEKIYRRCKDGTFEGTPVVLRVPREPELRRARVTARRMATADGIDEIRDKDLFEDLETVCILWEAVRMPTTPHEPLVLTPSELEKTYDKRSLMHLWGVLDHYITLLDPRPDTLNANELTFLIAAIAKGRDIRPLRACGSLQQSRCIVSMAVQLVSFWELKSLSAPSASLTPESLKQAQPLPPSEEPT